MALPDDAFDPDAPGDGGGLFGLPHTPDEAAVVVVPVPFEATTSYGRGTAGGPAAILAASRQVDLHDVETGSPWKAGIAMEPVDPRIAQWNEDASADAKVVIAAGGLDPDDADLVARCKRVDAIGDELNALVHARTAHWLEKGRIAGLVGGDHSVSFGAMRAAAELFPGLGILHVDAHCDLRAAYEGFTWSHASILYNVLERVPGIDHVVQVGIRDVGQRERRRARDDERITAWMHPHVAWRLAGGEPWAREVHRMIEPLPDRVWITFDIDGLDPSLCPHTGTPVPGGLNWHQALVLLRVLAESGRQIVGFDLAEVAPGDDDWDANVGARLLYKLAGWALFTQGGRR